MGLDLIPIVINSNKAERTRAVRCGNGHMAIVADSKLGQKCQVCIGGSDFQYEEITDSVLKHVNVERRRILRICMNTVHKADGLGTVVGDMVEEADRWGDFEFGRLVKRLFDRHSNRVTRDAWDELHAFTGKQAMDEWEEKR